MINNAGLFSVPSLIIFTKGANNSGHNCICNYTPGNCCWFYEIVLYVMKCHITTDAAMTTCILYINPLTVEILLILYRVHV